MILEEMPVEDKPYSCKNVLAKRGAWIETERLKQKLYFSVKIVILFGQGIRLFERG